MKLLTAQFTIRIWMHTTTRRKLLNDKARCKTVKLTFTGPGTKVLPPEGVFSQLNQPPV